MHLDLPDPRSNASLSWRNEIVHEFGSSLESITVIM